MNFFLKTTLDIWYILSEKCVLAKITKWTGMDLRIWIIEECGGQSTLHGRTSNAYSTGFKGDAIKCLAPDLKRKLNKRMKTGDGF